MLVSHQGKFYLINYFCGVPLMFLKHEHIFMSVGPSDVVLRTEALLRSL